MRKLGASTRSQAVVLALRTGEIGGETGTADGAGAAAGSRGGDLGPTLESLLGGFVAIADIETGAIYLSDDGTLLRLAAHAGIAGRAEAPPAVLTLGDPGIGRVALERRAKLISASAASSEPSGPLLAAPLMAAGRLVGVLALGVRHSRPTSRRELLLMEAFANRIAEILANGADPAALKLTLKRFRASWTETLHS